ncbi:MAG: hypothetical protein CL843_00840 [Crocinitomicaceae bacterium]|nr:hypothetical protein [Crocinitomicaceae bacterium]|tara:strand:- start:9861 stop:10526 length:666 start_codon:yes stop_codon:yes gene_type:complete
MKAQKTIARTFGIFFLLAFLSYGIGNGLAGSVTNTAESLSHLSTHKTTLVVGVLLMALVHSVVNIGLPVLMVPVLKPYNKMVSYGYLSAGIVATIVLIVGALFLLLHLPLSSMYSTANAAEIHHLETLGVLLTKGNFYAYQIGMAIWGIGGLMFCYLLLVSKLVPQWITIWGFVGYLVFIAGTILELFGISIGVQLSLPGGLFEITLSICLIVRGFRGVKI